jgi:hypothetical protein
MKIIGVWSNGYFVPNCIKYGNIPHDVECAFDNKRTRVLNMYRLFILKDMYTQRCFALVSHMDVDNVWKLCTNKFPIECPRIEKGETKKHRKIFEETFGMKVEDYILHEKNLRTPPVMNMCTSPPPVRKITEPFYVEIHSLKRRSLFF